MSLAALQLLGSKAPLIINPINQTSIRCLATHWNPKYTRLRAEKFKKVNLPKYDEIRNRPNETPAQQRATMKKEGIDPPRSFEYKPLNITSSGQLFDPYVPPEGDGKQTMLSKEGFSQKYLQVKSIGTKWRHERKIQQYDESFNQVSFPEDAQRIFVEAHDALSKRDSKRLIELVTESCYPKMWYQNKFKTVRWKLIQALEPPMVVHMITRELMSKANIYAQVTVRMHSQQTLAVYDRFGRLAYGDPNLVKNVLEYVVFERNLTNKYGVWRLHDKIVPEWAEPKMPIVRTFYKPKPMKVDESLEDKKPKFNENEDHLEDVKGDGPEQPKIASA